MIHRYRSGPADTRVRSRRSSGTSTTIIPGAGFPPRSTIPFTRAFTPRAKVKINRRSLPPLISIFRPVRLVPFALTLRSSSPPGRHGRHFIHSRLDLIGRKTEIPGGVYVLPETRSAGSVSQKDEHSRRWRCISLQPYHSTHHSRGRNSPHVERLPIRGIHRH